MANGIKCSVKFGRFKWNRAGYAEVMNSGPVQSLVAKPAREIADACNASFEPEPGEGEGYEVREVRGKLARGFAVGTATPHAHNSERRHNRLIKALGGVGE